MLYDIIIIKNLNNEKILFDIYRKFNSGATKLNPQELRHCAYQGKFNSLLQDLAKYEPFKKCFETKEVDRMEREEYILRFLALHEGLNKNKARKINYKSLSKSVFDMQMLGFVDFDSDLIIRHKDKIKQRYEDLVLNNENMRPFYKKASKKAAVFRINEWKKEIAQIINS